MKIKRIIIFSLIIFLFSSKNVFSLTKSELTIMNLKKITDVEKPNNYTSVQGGITTDKYVITLFINETDPTDRKTAILLLDKNTLKKVKRLDNPIKEYDFGHANDATYNSKTKELAVLAGRKIYFLNLEDDSFSLNRIKKLSHYYHGLGYDELNDQYVLARTINSGTRFEIVDSNFKRVNSFSIKTNLTKQSLTVYQGNIYYVCYEAGMITKYQHIYDGLLKRKENLIYVYSVTGKKKTIYYIPYSYKEIIFGEIENISFNNDKMLIQFNHTGKAGYFTPQYREEVNATIKINVDDNNQDNKEIQEKVYSLEESEAEIQRVRKTGNKIIYSLRYTKEGNYIYDIKEKNITETIPEEIEETTEEINENITIEDNLNKLLIDVYYDPTVNKLKYKSNEKNLTLVNGILEDKEKALIETEDTINIPNTSTMR